MKQTKYRHLRVITPAAPKYPNAADQNYYTQKAIDILTAIVSGMGFISAMIFLVTLS